MVRGTKCTKYKQRLRELFSLEKRRRDLSAVYNYLRGGYRDNRTRVFLRVHSDRTRGNRHKLGHGKFQLDIRKTFCTMRVVKHGNSLGDTQNSRNKVTSNLI